MTHTNDHRVELQHEDGQWHEQCRYSYGESHLARLQAAAMSRATRYPDSETTGHNRAMGRPARVIMASGGIEEYRDGLLVSA